MTALLHWAVTFLVQRPLGAHRDRAADLRPAGARRSCPAGPRELVSRPGDFDDRRAELEARAAEEARLTDSGERGRARLAADDARGVVRTSLEAGWLAVLLLRQGLAGPLRQDEDALDLDGRAAVVAAELSLDEGLDALDPVDPGLDRSSRRAGSGARSAGSGCRSCRVSRRRPHTRRAPGRAAARARRRARSRAVLRRARRGGTPPSAWPSPVLVDVQRYGDRVAQPDDGVAVPAHGPAGGEARPRRRPRSARARSRSVSRVDLLADLGDLLERDRRAQRGVVERADALGQAAEHVALRARPRPRSSRRRGSAACSREETRTGSTRRWSGARVRPRGRAPARGSARSAQRRPPA